MPRTGARQKAGLEPQGFVRSICPSIPPLFPEGKPRFVLSQQLSLGCVSSRLPPSPHRHGDWHSAVTGTVQCGEGRGCSTIASSRWSDIGKGGLAPWAGKPSPYRRSPTGMKHTLVSRPQWAAQSTASRGNPSPDLVILSCARRRAAAHCAMTRSARTTVRAWAPMCWTVVQREQWQNGCH